MERLEIGLAILTAIAIAVNVIPFLIGKNKKKHP